MKNKGINKCPFCSGSSFSHYRCRRPVVLCKDCGKVLMYYTQYIEYDKTNKEILETNKRKKRGRLYEK